MPLATRVRVDAMRVSSALRRSLTSPSIEIDRLTLVLPLPSSSMTSVIALSRISPRSVSRVLSSRFIERIASIDASSHAASSPAMRARAPSASAAVSAIVTRSAACGPVSPGSRRTRARARRAASTAAERSAAVIALSSSNIVSSSASIASRSLLLSPPERTAPSSPASWMVTLMPSPPRPSNWGAGEASSFSAMLRASAQRAATSSNTGRESLSKPSFVASASSSSPFMGRGTRPPPGPPIAENIMLPSARSSPESTTISPSPPTITACAENSTPAPPGPPSTMPSRPTSRAVCGDGSASPRLARSVAALDASSVASSLRSRSMRSPTSPITLSSPPITIITPPESSFARSSKLRMRSSAIGRVAASFESAMASTACQRGLSSSPLSRIASAVLNTASKSLFARRFG